MWPNWKATIHELGVDNVSLLVMTITNNSAGGQPVSMQNLKEVYALGQKYGLPVCIDAARLPKTPGSSAAMKTAIRRRPSATSSTSSFRYADLFTMSAKRRHRQHRRPHRRRDAQKHADLVEQINPTASTSKEHRHLRWSGQTGSGSHGHRSHRSHRSGLSELPHRPAGIPG